MISDESINIKVYEEVHRSVVNITNVVVEHDHFSKPYASESTGSGIVLDQEGHILTNEHVIAQATRLEVTLSDGTKWEATVVGKDSATDIAILQILTPQAQLKPIRFGDSNLARVGQKVLVIGNPFGLGQTLTTGIVSSIRKVLKIGEIEIENIIQTDAAINPGNSGGPLLDGEGRMIGPNTAIFSISGGNVGIGFSIPSNTVKWVAEELITRGYVAYGWLGIETQILNPHYAAALKLPVDYGIMVGRLLPRGPADQAGILGGNSQIIIGNTRLIIGGDIIIAADGKAVTSKEELIRILRTRRPETLIVLTIIRDNKEQTIEVPLGERPRS